MKRPWSSGLHGQRLSCVGSGVSELAGRPSSIWILRIEARFGAGRSGIFTEPRGGRVPVGPKPRNSDECSADPTMRARDPRSAGMPGATRARLRAIGRSGRWSRCRSPHEVVEASWRRTRRGRNLAVTRAPSRRAAGAARHRVRRSPRAARDARLSDTRRRPKGAGGVRRDPLGVRGPRQLLRGGRRQRRWPGAPAAACEPSTAILLISDQNVAPLHAAPLEALLKERKSAAFGMISRR
jgi:hypothetical protein